MCLPTGHLAGRGPEVHGPVWEGGYQAGRSPSPRGGALPAVGAPKCFADNRMRLNNVILCTSRWDDGGLSLSARRYGALEVDKCIPAAAGWAGKQSPGVGETAVPGSVSVEA